jgi:hypothetical protein
MALTRLPVVPCRGNDRYHSLVTGLRRYSDMPAAGPGELPTQEQNLVMRTELPITGHVLMATDMLRSMGAVQQTASAITPPCAWT